MNNQTIDKTSVEPESTVDQVEAQGGKLHGGLVARILAQVSTAAEEHAAYKLSKCEWRWIAS